MILRSGFRSGVESEFYKMYINMLGFASSEKKVAVSPSVSVETLTDDQMQEFITYLSDYKALSCRRRTGLKAD